MPVGRLKTSVLLVGLLGEVPAIHFAVAATRNPFTATVTSEGNRVLNTGRHRERTPLMSSSSYYLPTDWLGDSCSFLEVTPPDPS